MKGWLNRKRHSDVESELVESRATPPDSLVRSITGRIKSEAPALRTSPRFRLGLAAAALVSVAAVLGATGGFSYAASSLAKLVHVTKSATHAKAARPSHGPTAPCSTYGIPPTIGSFTPASGQAGQNVSITGTNYKNGTDNWVTSVRFNGAAASVIINSATNNTAHVPPNATTGHISVTNCKGTATSAGTFKPLPKVNGFTPGAAKAGASVTVKGTNFTGATSVKFHGVPATFTVSSYTTIVAKVPAGATVGPISVTTPAGTKQSATSFKPIPTIKSFTPSGAQAGKSVIINGANFLHAASVKFHGAPATFVVNSFAKITAKVPPSATVGKITVTTNGGTATSGTAFKPIPRIQSFTPTSGKPGTTVTIKGTNFLHASQVRFHGITATFTVKSYAGIVAKVPNLATTGHIQVSTPGGTATSIGNFTVTH